MKQLTAAALLLAACSAKTTAVDLEGVARDLGADPVSISASAESAPASPPREPGVEDPHPPYESGTIGPGGATIPPAPDCARLFRENDHVATFHCADDYLSEIALVPGAAADPKYRAYRGLSFLLAAPEISLGMNGFLSLFGASAALPWTQQLYGVNGLFALVNEGVTGGVVDATVTLPTGQTVALAPRYIAYVGSPARARLAVESEAIDLQLVFRNASAFDVTDGTPIDRIAPCASPEETATCLEGSLVWAGTTFELMPASSGVDVAALGIEASDAISLANGALLFSDGARTVSVELRSAVDLSSPLETQAIQKLLAIGAPLYGTSISADEILSRVDTPDAMLWDLAATVVRNAKRDAPLNDLMLGLFDLLADLDGAVVDLRAAAAEPTLRFVFPKEIFRTTTDLELTALDLRLLAAGLSVVATAGELLRRALAIDPAVTRSQLWTGSDVAPLALLDALNDGFLLPNAANTGYFRTKLTSELSTFAELARDLAAESCAPSRLFGCLLESGASFAAMFDELAAALNDGPRVSNEVELASLIGAPELALPETLPFSTDPLAILSTSRAVAAGDPFFLRTLPSGAQRIALSDAFFDAVSDHLQRASGTRVTYEGATVDGTPRLQIGADAGPLVAPFDALVAESALSRYSLLLAP